MSFFSALESAFSSWFSKSEAETVAFLKPLAASIVANGGTVLINAAVSAVSAAETTGGSGAAKMAAAKAAVTSTLTNQGLAVAESAINGAIEAAVANLPKQIAGIAGAVATSIQS